MTTLRDLIAQHCAGMTDYEAIAAVLNAPTTVDNPDDAPYFESNPPTLKEIYAIIPLAEAAAIYNKAGLSADIRNAIDSGDLEYMAMMMAIVAQLGIISAPTIAALSELIQRQRTVTPPATIAGPSLAAAAGLGSVSSAAVQSALN